MSVPTTGESNCLATGQLCRYCFPFPPSAIEIGILHEGAEVVLLGHIKPMCSLAHCLLLVLASYLSGITGEATKETNHMALNYIVSELVYFFFFFLSMVKKLRFQSMQIHVYFRMSSLPIFFSMLDVKSQSVIYVPPAKVGYSV